MLQPSPPGNPHVRSFDDLLDLEPDQLSHCLTALRAWIGRTRRLRARAEADGVDPKSLQIAPFTWTPRTTGDPVGRPRPETPIEDLGLRRAAVAKLHEMRIYCLEDLTVCTENEIGGQKHLGEVTLDHLRTHLAAAGLSFRENENPVHRALQKAQVARRLPVEARQVDDSSPVHQLGLRPTTVERLLQIRIETVGQLRGHTLRQLFAKFGKKSLTEIMDTLKALGLELQEKPGQLEMWRYGAIHPRDLVRPAMDSSVDEMAPWVGLAVTKSLSLAGVASVAEAMAIAQGGRAGEKAGQAHSRRVPGLGSTGLERLQEYFSTPKSRASTGAVRGSLFPGS